MQTFFFMQFIFQALLIYTGVTTITTDEDDEDDPSQNPMVLWLQKHFSVVNAYDLKACFFVNVSEVGGENRSGAEDPHRESKPSAHAPAPHARHDRSMARDSLGG